MFIVQHPGNYRNNAVLREQVLHNPKPLDRAAFSPRAAVSEASPFVCVRRYVAHVRDGIKAGGCLLLVVRFIAQIPI